MARQAAAVPDGLYLVMRPWLKEVLRFQPDDIVRFSRDYFTSLCSGDEENFLNLYAKENGFPKDRRLLEEKESKMQAIKQGSALDPLAGGSNRGSRRNSRKKDLNNSEYSQTDSSSSAGLGLLPAKVEADKRLSQGQFNIAATQTVNNTVDHRGGVDDGNDKEKQDAGAMHLLIAIAVHAIHKALNNALQGQPPTPTALSSPTANLLLNSPTSASSTMSAPVGKAKAPIKNKTNRDAYYELNFDYGTSGSTASITFPDDFPRSRAILRLKGSVGSGDKKRVVDKKIPIESIATQSADCGPFVKEVIRHVMEEGGE